MSLLPSTKKKLQMQNVTLSPDAIKHLDEWIQSNPKIALKIISLLKEIAREPFSGTGKPEPLKHHLKGYWSRRITDEHRLIYKVTDQTVIITSCKYHY